MSRIAFVILFALAADPVLAALPKPVATKLAFDPYVYPSGTNLVKNPNFDDGITNWVVIGNYDFTARAAGKALRFNAGQKAPDAVVSQTFTTIPGLTYSAGFDYGVISYAPSATQVLKVTVSTAGTALYEQTISATGTTNGAYNRHTFTFRGSGTNAVIVFRDLSTTSDSIDSMIDDVVVDPTSMTGMTTVYRRTWLGTVASPWKKTAVMPWTRNTATVTVLPGTYHFRAIASMPETIGSTNWLESEPSNVITNIVK